MKLIIQIPCYNESETIGIALDALPLSVPGFDTVEWLIVDDGSTDDTVKVARDHGVHHIVQHTNNQGLAKGFMSGIEACLRLGANVIVNTDADNQYNANDIPKLVSPIIEKRADVVVGARPIDNIGHFSTTKKFLQKLGSWVVRAASNTDIPDAPSGFRAISRDAAQHIIVFNEYTYTLETIIQAGQKNMAITYVPIRVNAELRSSRLVKSILSYVRQSIITILRIFIIYRPFRFLGIIAVILFGLGFFVGLRYLWFYLNGDGKGHIQSLILSTLLMGAGFQTFLIALVTDLQAANRKLLEDIRYKISELFRKQN